MKTNTNMLAKAIALAAKVFESTLDKGGKPYILHCLWVMNNVRHLGEEAMIIAVLHDVVEDFKITGITLEHLREMGFSTAVISGVAILTHDKENVEYDEYIRLVGAYPDKRIKEIKKKDLEHNSKVTRLKGLRQKDFERLQKYCTAYEYLKD